MLPYLIAVPLMAHGLANLAGVFAPWAKNLAGFSDSAWYFTGQVTLRSVWGRAFSLVWLASSLCLAAAGSGVLLHQSWWVPMASLGCLLSFAAIAPWWRAVPPGARFGAVFDVLVIAWLVSPFSEQIVQALR